MGAKSMDLFTVTEVLMILLHGNFADFTLSKGFERIGLVKVLSAFLVLGRNGVKG
jgi:hypothetical protein